VAFEKVLNLPPLDVIGQQTIFHCGPGSAENILISLGIPADEWELAMACRTTENGTDWIGQIRDVLQQRAHHMDWRLQEMPNDPATPQQKQKLWDDVFNSIVHAGAPCLMNFVAPMSNYPRASRPSPIDGQVRNPSYGGGTVYHYVTCFGVAEDDNGTKHMLIVDSGFNPTVYWITHDQCATLIPPKGYVYGHAEPAGVPVLPGPAAALDEAEALSIAMGGSLGIDRYRALVPAVKDALRQSECTNPRRVAAWFAQIGHESAGLRYMEEIADGSAYEGRADLGNIQPGDGMGTRSRSWGQPGIGRWRGVRRSTMPLTVRTTSRYAASSTVVCTVLRIGFSDTIAHYRSLISSWLERNLIPPLLPMWMLRRIDRILR
jgi:hypothetical protein